MRALNGIFLLIPPFLGHASAQGGSAAPGSIRGDVFRKGIHGEPAVLSGELIKSDAKGAFVVDNLPPGTCQIEANAPRLYAAVAAVSADASSTGSLESNVAAFSGTTSARPTRLRAMDCALSRKVHHHA